METNKLTKQQRLIIFTVAFGILLNPLNSSMIAVGLVRIQEDFTLTFIEVSWLISTFYLASAIGQPIMGKLSDLFGRKRLFFLGLILVVVASILAPFSPSYGWLIGFRLLQAIGSSTLFPAGMGMVRHILKGNQGRGLAILSVFSSTSAAFGPSIGGFLIDVGDWPLIFLINIPFVLISLTSAIFVLPKDTPKKDRKIHLDYSGITLFAMMIVSWLLFFLSFKDEPSWLLFIVSLALTVIFYQLEKKSNQPFIDVKGMVENKNMSFVFLQFALINSIFYSIFFGVPAYLQQVHGFDEKTAGLMMLSVSGFGVISAPIAGRWIDKKGSKPPLLLAAIFLLGGLLLLLTVKEQSNTVWMFIVLSILGVSTGFNNLGLQTALYDFVSEKETSAASGLFMTSRYIGTIFSSSILGIVFHETIVHENFHALILICIPIALAILGLTIRMPAKKAEKAAA